MTTETKRLDLDAIAARFARGPMLADFEADTDALIAEVRRLRGLIKLAEWCGHSDEWGGYDGETDVLPACPWCEDVQPGKEGGHRNVRAGHAPGCPAFLPSGEVR